MVSGSLEAVLDRIEAKSLEFCSPRQTIPLGIQGVLEQEHPGLLVQFPLSLLQAFHLTIRTTKQTSRNK